MKVYLDTSVVLRRMLRQRGALSDWSGWSSIYSSVLLRVESLRTLDRLRLEGLVTDEQRAALREQLQMVFDSITLVHLSDHLLERASQPFPAALGTIDAIHLSTALAISVQEGVDLMMVTHDEQLARAARSMGLPASGTA